MKYIKRANQYRNSTGNNIVQFDDKHALQYASSYSWYEYIKVFVHPKTLKKITVLNRTSYSPTTVRHIHDAYKVLGVNRLSDSFDLILDDVPHSLSDLSRVIDSLKRQAARLEEEANQPRTHASKNLSRRIHANVLINQAMFLNVLRGV
jgi:hypothetical protein